MTATHDGKQPQMSDVCIDVDCRALTVSDVLINNIKYAMIAQMQNPTPGFEDVIKTHFYLKRDRLLQVCMVVCSHSLPIHNVKGRQET